jgi:hypothetical protein
VSGQNNSDRLTTPLGEERIDIVPGKLVEFIIPRDGGDKQFPHSVTMNARNTHS